jgi:hypothetical protein
MSTKINRVSTSVAVATAVLMLAAAGCASRTDDIRASAPQGDRDQQPLIAQAAPTDQSQLPDATGMSSRTSVQSAGWDASRTAQSGSSVAPSTTTSAASVAQASGSSAYGRSDTAYNGIDSPSAMDRSAATSSLNGASTVSSNGYGNAASGGTGVSNNAATNNAYGTTSHVASNASASDNATSVGKDQALAPRTDRN